MAGNHLSIAAELDSIPDRDLPIALRRVRLNDYNGVGYYFSLELLSKRHKVFGYFLRIADSKTTPTPMEVPFDHLMACIKAAVETNPASPIKIPDYLGKYMLEISLDKEKDIEEDKPLVLIRIVDGSVSTPIVVSQQILKLRTDMLLESATAPAPAAA